MPDEQPGDGTGPGTPTPSPSPADARRVDHLVAVLGEAGVFAPDVPDPAILYPAVGDRCGAIDAVGVLRALGEADRWTPGVDPTRYSANLAVHGTHVEQWADVLAGQATDLARLAGGTVPVEVLEVDQETPPPGTRRTRTRIALLVAGRPFDLDYAGTTKDLSTVLHVELCRALRATGAPLRVAALSDDGGLLLTGLPDQDLDALNAALGLPPADPLGWGGWTWLDETRPRAAGDPSDEPLSR